MIDRLLICFLLHLLPSYLFAQTARQHNLKNGLNDQYTYASNGEYLLIHNRIGKGLKGEVKVLKTEDGMHYEPVQDLQGPALLSGFGVSVAITDDLSRIAVGAYQLNKDTGAVFIYEWQEKAASWELAHQIFPEVSGVLNFGHTVAIAGDGNRLAVGAPSFVGDNADQGACLVYDLSTKDTITYVGCIRSHKNERHFGEQVKISADGSIVAVGASTDDWKERCEGAINVYQWSDKGYVPLGNRIALAKDTCNHFATKIELSADGLRLASGVSSKKYAALVWEYDADTDKWQVLGAGIPPFGGSRDHSSQIVLHPQGNKLALSKGLGADYGEAMLYELVAGKWALKGNKVYGNRGHFTAMAFNFPLGVMVINEVYMPKNIPDLIEEVAVYKWE